MDWNPCPSSVGTRTYTCARLARLASEISDGGRLNYRRIWNIQGGDDVLRRQIDVIGEKMMDLLRSPPREGQNITEWAKQQACRERALKTPVDVVDGFRNWVVDAETDRSEQKEKQAAGAIDEDLRIMEMVLQVSASTWSALRQYARSHKLLLPKDDAALRAACGESGKPPNEIQARALQKLLNRAQEHGWEAPEPIGELA